MSTYYYGSIYRKKDDVWSVVDRDIYMNCVKNFVDCHTIEANDVFVKDDELDSLIEKTDYFYSTKFLGLVSKKNIEKFFYREIVDRLIHQASSEKRARDDSQLLIFTEDDLELLKVVYDNKLFEDVDLSNWQKMSFDERKKKADEQYTIEIKYRNYFNGDLYDSKSFDDIIKQSRDNLDKIKRKKDEWDKLSSSLDYLKLTSKEKENVFDSYQYEIEDIDDYYKYRLESALQIKYTLELLSGYEDNVYMRIYNADNYYNKLPDWVNVGLF